MITKQQRNTLHFIRAFIQENGFAPTMFEIAKGINIQSKGAAARHVEGLEKAGYIQRLDGQHRNIRLLDKGSEEADSIPLIGKIAAGRPLEVFEDKTMINLATVFAKEGRFALRVDGASMVEAGILDGDTIIIERVDGLDALGPSDIIVALVDGQATLKHYQLSQDRQEITLIPANSDMSAMTYSTDRVSIQGRYVGLLRFH